MSRGHRLAGRTDIRAAARSTLSVVENTMEIATRGVAVVTLAAVMVLGNATAGADPAYNTPDPAQVKDGLYLYCLQGDGVDWRSNRSMYLTVGHRVYQALVDGTDPEVIQSGLVQHGAPPQEALIIVACARNLR